MENEDLREEYDLRKLKGGVRGKYYSEALRNLDMALNVPDDYCEGCHKQAANRECAHGILCDECDADIHGEIGGKCEL